MSDKAETRLEDLFRQAATEPAHRPDFYKALLDARVYVLGTADAGEGRATLSAGETVALQHWEDQNGDPIIPFFTSLETLSKSIEREDSYLALPARSLFEMTLGARLVLNPRSDHWKEFVPEEIRSLLDTGVNHQPQARVVEQETEVLIGQPSDYPDALVRSLSILFAKHENVRAAYLALMHDPSVDDGPHLLVGIEGDEPLQQTLQEAGSIAAEVSPDGGAVDFIRVQRGGADVSEYLLSTPPFYAEQ